MGMIDEQLAPQDAPAADPAAADQPPTTAAVAPEAPAAEAPGEPQGAGSPLQITPASILAKLHLQPAQKPQLQRMVLAGKKIMFDESTFHLLADVLKSKEGDLVQKIGTGITGLMALLIQESKNSLPGELIIPAGMVLVAEAADFLVQSGEALTDKDVADAIQVFIHVVLNQTGMDGDKMAEAGGAAAAAELQKTAAQDAPPDAPTPQGAPAPQGGPAPAGGIINSAAVKE